MADTTTEKADTTSTGSGQWAVFDATLGQYVSGVGDKATANASKKELESHNGAVTDGHDLQVREV